MLPDDVLLELFDIYLDQAGHIETWHTLVHVCRQWRCVVFASPLRLKLQLLCSTKRPVMTTLAIWPAFPIAIDFDFVTTGVQPQGMDNIIATLELHNRVCSINIRDIPNSLLNYLTAIRRPFPMLTELKISSRDKAVPTVPDTFLGRSTSQLRTLGLDGIPFLGLRKLLLSTRDLVDLDLRRIPHSGYIPPQAIISGLSSLMRLKKLILKFESPQYLDDRASWHPLPLRRIFLPALTVLVFKGDNQYLEDIVSRIDTPLLDCLGITFFNQLMFDTPLLSHFISRTETFTAVHYADVFFGSSGVRITLMRRNGTSEKNPLTLQISCRPLIGNSRQ